jgi:TP901 family phage tail tape measure protein
LSDSTHTMHMRANAKEILAELDEVNRRQKELKDELDKASNAWTTLGGTMLKAGAAMTAVFTVPIIGFFTGAVKTAAEFEQAMAGVKAISGETGAAFEALEEQAKYLGSTTRYTAVEAAQGMTMLARAGWDAQEILAGMPGMLDLAAAGAVDLATAADIVSDVMMAFGENADQAGRYADVFAQAAANANTTVEMLGSAMAYAAPAAAAAGFSLEQTAAALSALADAGIKGTRAGTTMDSVLRELRNKVKDGALDFGAFTVSVYDSEGAMRDLFSILGDIETGMTGMTQEQRDAALSMVFTTRSLRGMNVWLTRGVDSLKELEGALINSGGAAERMAETMMGTLQGSVIRMQSAMEGLRIAFGEAFLPYVKGVVDWVTALVSGLANLDETTIKLITVIGLVVAAIGPLLVIGGTLISLIGQIILFGPLIATTFAPFIAILGPIAAVVAALAIVGIAAVTAYGRWQKEHATMEQTLAGTLSGVLDDYRVKNAAIIAEQAERHLDSIDAEIDHLIEMGHTVEKSTELQDAYERQGEAILALQRARHMLEIEQQRQFDNSIAKSAEEFYSNMNEVTAQRFTELVDNVASSVDAQIKELQRMYHAGEITIGEYLALANQVEQWGEDMVRQAGLSMTSYMTEHERGLAGVGQVWDSQLLAVVDIAGHHVGEIRKAIVDNLDGMDEDMAGKAREAIQTLNIALKTGNTELRNEALADLLNILSDFGIDFRTQMELIGLDSVNYLASGIEGLDEVLAEEFDKLPDTAEEKIMAMNNAAKTILKSEFHPMMSAEAKRALELFAEGTDEGTDEAMEIMNKLIRDIEMGFYDLDLRPAGAETTAGYGEGLVDSWALRLVEDNVEQVVDKVEKSFKRFADIQSPSKLTYGIGVDVTRGFAEGIIGGISYIQQAVKDIIDIVINSFNDIKNRIKDSFEGVGDIIGNSLDGAKSNLQSGVSMVVRLYTDLSSNVILAIDTLKNNALRIFDGIKTNLQNISRETVRIILDAFKNLPSEIRVHLNAVLDNLRRFGVDAYNRAREAARRMIDGFIQTLRTLPQQIWNIILEIGRRLLQAGSYLYNLARQAAQRLLQGFLAGIEKRSPSALERAMDDIVERARKMYPELVDAFGNLHRLQRLMPDLEIPTHLKSYVEPVTQARSREAAQIAQQIGDAVFNSLMLAFEHQKRDEKGDIVLQIDGREFARIMKTYNERESIRVCAK